MKNRAKSIPLAKPLIGREEIKAVNRVLRSGNLAQGSEVLNFEKEFSLNVGERECVAVNSGTSALHVALLALGVGPGDEVIVPSFTFAATANSVVLAGANPIFVDIDPKTFNINPQLIESAITNKTKAIQVVHLYGLPANMIEIAKIAKKYSLLLVEDAAQAHLAEISEQRVGTFGDAAAFSFYPTKNMTSGEGGMIVLKDAQVARKCRLLRNQGMESRYQNEIVGFNLRMTDVHAAIGRQQLLKLPNWTEKRISNANLLKSKIDFDITPKVPNGYKHVYHQYTIRLEKNRNGIADELSQNGIGNSVYYPTQVHKLPAFDSSQILLETKLATETVLSIPVHPSLHKRDIIRIASTLNRILEKN